MYVVFNCQKCNQDLEVGHDLFEEKFAKAIEKIGTNNVFSVHAIGYGYMDTVGHMLARLRHHDCLPGLK